MRWVILLLFFSFVCFGEIAVVANPSFKNSSNLKDLLLGVSKRNVVIYLTDDPDFNETAIRKLIGITYEDFKIFWLEKALRGEGVPPKELPPEEVRREVRSRRNAIGIIPLRYVKDLKVLKVVR